MRRRLLALGLLLVASGLVAGVALLVAEAKIRARYHLRRASAAEVWLLAADTPALIGHAGKFAESPAAKELLPELIELAHEEAESDLDLCYRPLVFQVAGCSAADRPVQITIIGIPPDTRRPLVRFEVTTLRALALGLRSRHSELRRWSLVRIPQDERLLEAVLATLTGAPAQPYEPSPERRAALLWLAAFHADHKAEIGSDPAWLWALRWRSDNCGHERFNVLDYQADPAALQAWFERHRDRFPGQVK